MTPDSSCGRRRWIAAGASVLSILAAAIIAVAVTAVAAPAKSPGKPIVTVARSVEVGSAHEPIAVSPHGLPVYDLLPETTRHLLCTRASGCLSFWPAVTVAKGAKLVKGAGLKGKLGTFKHDGVTQVTLNGHPLYTFAEDHSPTEAHGDGLKSFGGTWHVFKQGAATGSTGAGTTSTSPTTATTSTTTPYRTY